MLVGLGILFRALAFWSLVAFNRDKRHLPTLAQLSLYWVVNPLDNLANARRERRHEERRAERIRRYSVQPHNQLPSLGVRVGNPFGGPVLERPPASRYSGYQPPPQQQEPQQPQQPRQPRQRSSSAPRGNGAANDGRESDDDLDLDLDSPQSSDHIQTLEF